MMAFTRLIAGPMDYHLGRIQSRPASPVQTLATLRRTCWATRCHMLAMYVCFDNPNPMVADFSHCLRGTTWIRLRQTRPPPGGDETRVVASQVGEVISPPRRRKGATWYLGGMSAKRPPRFDPFDVVLLEKGRYKREGIWKDASDAGV